jgi:hypothetical protein
MSRRFQATVSILVGVLLAAIGTAWSFTAACCGGMPTFVAYSFAGFGLAVLGIGVWALRARGDQAGLVRGNPLYATLALLGIATLLLAHVVYGVRRERVLAMAWEPSSAYFGKSFPAAADAPVLRYESHPDTFHVVDDAELAGYLRALPDHRVEATVELVYVFGRLRSVRLVQVGSLARPSGFAVTSGVRGAGGGSTPWD